MGTIDFDRGTGVANLVSAGSSDVFVAKYDAAGNYIWAKRMGGADQEFGKSIAIDANYNVYTTGYWSNTADFDPGAGIFNMITNGGPNDAFISKLDASGNFIFAKQFAGASHTYGYSIDLDASGNIYTTGYFGGTVDFNPGAGTFNLSTTLGGDIFVSKLDGNGNFVWAKAIIGNTTGNDIGHSIVVDDAQNVYITGIFTGTADFDPGVGVYNLTTTAYTNAYVCKLDGNGNFSWAIKCGDANTIDAKSIALDNNQNVYITGFYVNTVDFNPGADVFNLTSNNGSADAYILKLADCPLPSSPVSISGSNSICEASSTTYSIASVSEASNYVWNLPLGWTGSSNTTSIDVVAGITGGDITVYAENGCGNSSTQSLPVIVNPNPIVSLILTPEFLCENSSSTTLSGGFPEGGLYSGNGIIGSDFDPSLAGMGIHSIDYTYIDVNSCSNVATDTITVNTCLALTQSNFSSKIEVFPTPSNDLLTIRCEEFSNNQGSISIYSILGEKIFSIQSHSVTNQIDISQFSSGVYFAEIEIGNQTNIVKMIKQ